jgi:hypothetical protein
MGMSGYSHESTRYAAEKLLVHGQEFYWYQVSQASASVFTKHRYLLLDITLHAEAAEAELGFIAISNKYY